MLKRTRKVALITLAVFIGLYSLIWLVSPTVTRLVLNKVLQSEKVQLTDDSHVRLNLFLSRLTVENFALVRSDQTTLQIEQMQVRYGLLKLLAQEVYIQKLTLDGLDMVLDVDGKDAHIAGFLLNRPAAPSDNNESNAAPGGGRKVAVAVPEIALKNLTLHIIQGNAQHQLEFSAINIERTLYEQAVLNSQATLKGAIDGAPFKIETHVNYGEDSSSATIELAINDIPLEKYSYTLPENIKQFSGRAGLTLKADLERKGNALFAKNIASTFTLTDFNYSDEIYQAQLGKFNLRLDEARANYTLPENGEENTSRQFDGKLQVTLENIESSLANSPDKLAGLDRLQVQDLLLSSSNSKVELNIKTIGANTLWFSSPSDTALPKIVSLNQLTIEDVIASQQSASIARVAIAGGEVSVIRNAQGEISNLVATSSTAQGADEPQEPNTVQEDSQQQNQQQVFTFELQKFELEKPIKVAVKDISVKPGFDETFYIANLNLASVSNSSPDNITNYNLAINDGEFFKLNLDGKITPFAEKLNGDFKLSTREFSLPEISPYVSDSLGFNISAGQMDLDFNGTITANQLKSVADSHLRGAEFKSDKNYDENDMLGQTAIPLNVALGMLKDGDGNIKLKIPVNGDVRSPDFSVRHIVGLVVRKAAMSQAKSYLIKTFIPYGQVLSVAMAAGSYALKVRFEDLPYSVTQLEPAEAQLVFANQLATLMQDKPDLQIKVCPVVTPSDLPQTAGKTTLSDVDKALLLDFGEQRAGAFKRFMVETKTIGSSRLLLCTPEIEVKSPEKPRIKFSI